MSRSEARSTKSNDRDRVIAPRQISRNAATPCETMTCGRHPIVAEPYYRVPACGCLVEGRCSPPFAATGA